MENETDRAAAIADINRAAAAANVARATAVFDALDDQSPRLSESDRYDFAYEAWQTCMDIDIPIPDNDVAALAIRASRHIAEEQLIDLVDVQFGEHQKRIRLDDENALTWLPEDDCLILRYPSRLLGFTVDAVLMRARTRA